MTDTLTPEKLEELKALALAATPGPWTIDMENEWDDGTNLPEQLNLRVNGSRWGKVVDAVHVDDSDAYFIAAANPACVLALISQAEAREGEIAKLRDGMPDLSPVIGWLNRGCDPRNAVIELQILQKRIVAALTREGDVS